MLNVQYEDGGGDSFDATLFTLQDAESGTFKFYKDGKLIAAARGVRSVRKVDQA